MPCLREGLDVGRLHVLVADEPRLELLVGDAGAVKWVTLEHN